MRHVLLAAVALFVACSGSDDDEGRIIDTSVPAALPVAGTYRASFDGEFSACDVGIVNDRILSVRRQYVLVLPTDAVEGEELPVQNYLGNQLYSCVRDLSDGTYYCGTVFDQHIGDDSNTYAWTLVHRFAWDDETSGTMTIDTEVTCSGSTCLTETCEDHATYTVEAFDDFEQLNQIPCAQAGLPANALQESLIEVRNLNSQPVDLTWVDWDGLPRVQQTIGSGSTVRQRVFAGHPWQARIGNTCIGTWVATDAIGQFDIP